MQMSLSLYMPLKRAYTYVCAQRHTITSQRARVHIHTLENEFPVIKENMQILIKDQGDGNITRLCLKDTTVLCLLAFRAKILTHVLYTQRYTLAR